MSDDAAPPQPPQAPQPGSGAATPTPESTPGAVPVITTARLVLRPRTATDADALFPAMSDPAVMHFWSRAPYGDVDALRADFARVHAGWRAWAIIRSADGATIGFVAAGEKWHGGVSEVGYLLARDAHRQGFAREALAGLIATLFAEGQRRVSADVDPDNAPSIALLNRLGFRREGRLRDEWRTHIGVRDSLIFGLLAAEWRG